jgi:hypothetical protein
VATPLGRLAAALLASALAAGCDRPFDPFAENAAGPFSMLGYLDLRADTQWVRVMPIRQTLLGEPGPVDAIVTLERVGSGRTVTLRDSLHEFTNARLDGAAYAHLFWTTERLEPAATYRLTAARSDGASTTALVRMPPALEFSLLNDPRIGFSYALLQVRAERVLFADVLYTVSGTGGDPAGSVAVREPYTIASGGPGLQGIGINVRGLAREGLVDVGRQEIALTVARADWPFPSELPDPGEPVPDTTRTNVENGVGFVGGVASWTIPFQHCEVLVPRPDGAEYCVVAFDARSASISGRVIREPCGRPDALADVRLTERFAGGGAIVRTWKTGWDGEYRFEGVEPGADLVLEVGRTVPAVHLPRLGPGERKVVTNIAVPGGC